MNLPFFVARRYLFAKKSHNAINIISGISVAGVTVGTMALIIVLSVFNGFDNLVKSLFNSFDPDLKITLVEGKVFSANDPLIKQIKTFDGIHSFTEVIEENAMLEYDKKQDIARVKGVSDNYSETSGIDTMIINGVFTIKDEHGEYAVVGHLLANRLSINLNMIKPIKIWAPKRNSQPSLTNIDAFNNKSIFPMGIFSVLQDDNNTETIIVPIDFARKLLEYDDEVSSIEIKLKPGIDAKLFHQKLEAHLKGKYLVKDRFQQHEFLYKVMQTEKWAIFLILSFILAIASFNLTGSLTMLIIDKKKDIITLQNMGATNKLIRNIFLLEGWLISIIGAILGIILGFMVCWLQQTFGLVKLQSESLIMDSYPVVMKIKDFIIVPVTVLLIGYWAAWYPVRYLSRKFLNKDL